MEFGGGVDFFDAVDEFFAGEVEEGEVVEDFLVADLDVSASELLGFRFALHFSVHLEDAGVSGEYFLHDSEPLFGDLLDFLGEF